MNITIFNEGRDEKNKPKVLEVYPNGIGGVLADIISELPKIDCIKITSLYEEECGLTEEVLSATDVLLYWSHGGNDLFPDHVATRIYEHVLKGMGFLVFHSAMGSKPFKKLMGSSCTMRYQHDVEGRVFCCNPVHPIAAGIENPFDIGLEESYGEFFDIPTPDDLIFLHWFSNKEVCRGGMTWTRGYGKIFYFQIGHETNHSFYNKNVRRIIQNACMWAKPVIRNKENPISKSL